MDDYLSSEYIDQVELFCKGYKAFLNRAKTERECIRVIRDEANRQGFTPLVATETLVAGGKYYCSNRNKSMALIVMGRAPLSQGVRIIAAHCDAPRLDLKPNPLHEAQGLALMRTHYYGGIKKYQWGARPLALHGVVFTRQHGRIELALGERDDQPVFAIPDLLPHLDAKIQRKRPGDELLKGEELQILVGSLPLADLAEETKARVKHQILACLQRDYALEEADFLRAELALVPAGDSRDVGFDGSLLGGYGQDDRVCVYTAWQALLACAQPEQTLLCLFLDKEETGSAGATGMQSDFFPWVIEMLLQRTPGAAVSQLRQCLWHSYALSADVVPALDPLFPEVHDADNAARLGGGMVLSKYTGAGGKNLTNDADAEYLALLQQMLDRHALRWQNGLLGKVDEGGGGTIARFLAQHGPCVVDAGVPLLSMHSPFEISAKSDIWQAFQGYRHFFAATFPCPSHLYDEERMLGGAS
ncbi:aminopeptidase [Edwardsiella hoshinae]|uniref:M18 family aminopeptidase n=1 Tax=Edwardsiella hoshinae TaxID=93378 RepID=A0A376DGE5_9GAMM|nr:aminopeptidase [Edwardsiella hoshinae]AOV97195.1 aminopeptidase [Edwardsiella hoshinae]QPR26960.1 aminopeptidase [Edwardsiella hoshinae]STC88940.1 Probable M18 family aminopeptidase 1 [Edwardsiella hoshinae]